MSRRRGTRCLLPRAPRGPTHPVRCRRPRLVGRLAPELRLAAKRTALRDCGRRCVYCATPLERETATLDHVWPLARGGHNAAGNLVTACVGCNQLKGDQLPEEFFARYPWAGLNFMRHARAAHRTLKRNARRAVSLALAA